MMRNVVRPVKEGPYPGVVLVHGPDYVGGSRADMEAWQQKLAARGYVAAAIDYRVVP
jgi:acetyl esterase/lipase